MKNKKNAIYIFIIFYCFLFISCAAQVYGTSVDYYGNKLPSTAGFGWYEKDYYILKVEESSKDKVFYITRTLPPNDNLIQASISSMKHDKIKVREKLSNDFLNIAVEKGFRGYLTLDVYDGNYNWAAPVQTLIHELCFFDNSNEKKYCERLKDDMRRYDNN